MDVTFVCFLVLCYAGLTSQFPQQDLQTLDVTTASSDTNLSDVNRTAAKCETARGLAGNCLDRQYCEYSTYAVDLTLYAPKDYKKPCANKEICCPFSFQLAVEPENGSKGPEKEITFDEDDK